MRAITRLLDRVVDALAVVAGVIFVAITLALIVNVAMRFFYRANLYGMVDGIEIGLMAATFLAAPWVLKENAHVAVDIFLAGLRPAARRRVDQLTCLAGAVLSFALFWTSFSALVIAWNRNSMIRGVLVVPEWMLLLAPTLGGALLAAVFVQQMVQGPRTAPQQPGL